MFKIIVLLGFLFVVASTQYSPFRVIREWRYLNFTWPSEESHQTAVAKGLYVPENNIIAGLKYFEDHYYLTLPRMKTGVPATLVKISAGLTSDTAPLLEPFPSWTMNMEGDCNALQNVQNVEIDGKGQMWIIDSGRTNTLGEAIIRCPPKLLIHDIKNNRTTTTYTFPENVASKEGSYLYNLVVDDTDGGYAYITDNAGKDPGILVYSVKENKSWKFVHSHTMRADSSATVFRVNGTVINSPINIAAIALGPKVRTTNPHIVVSEERDVYYCPLSSLHLYAVNTTVLKNEQNSQGEYQGEIKDVGIKAAQTAGMIMDNQGVLYYGLLGDSSIARWDSHTSFTSGQKLISKDAQYLQWPSSFTFDSTGNLTVLTNRLQNFIYSTLSLGEANFRLLSSHTGSRSYVYDNNYDYTEVTSTVPPLVHRTNDASFTSSSSSSPSYSYYSSSTTTTTTESAIRNKSVSESQSASEHARMSSSNRCTANLISAVLFVVLLSRFK